jgi:hypothetical protein
MSAADDAIFADLFQAEGAITLTWEQASRCTCWSDDSHQPKWDCPICGGDGVTFTAPKTVKGLFRSQSRWISPRREGEIDHGEAQLTTPLTVKPNFVDRRVRDRFVVTQEGDTSADRVFYPATPAVPFLFDGVQYAWRVQLQAADQTDRVVPQT